MKSVDPPKKRCPLCNSASINFNDHITRNERPFDTWICKDCSFIFMNPAFSDEKLASFYSDDYYLGNAAYSYVDEREKEKYFAHVWNARLRTIRSWVKGGNFLDIGCAFGGFLTSASKYFAPYGIELSPYSADYADRRTITVHNGTIDDAPYDDNFFSCITMIEMIEHLKDPASAIDRCYRMLQSGGILVIQTADMNAWQSRDEGKEYHYYLPGHLSYFSESNLCMVLRERGFSKIRLYRPVDFGLMPKLLKSRGNFSRISDYRAWFRIARYHYMGLFRSKGIPLTSSMVVYAQK